MYCNSCQYSCLGVCKQFGSYKPDSQLHSENFGCFNQRIYKVNKSLKNFAIDENIYLDEMTQCEIKEAIRYCNVIKKALSKHV